MTWLRRLDVQLSLIFIAVLSLTVSLTGWLHSRGHLINLVGPGADDQAHLALLEPQIRTWEQGTEPVRALLANLTDTDPERMYLVVNERFQLVADTTPDNSYVELVRREPDSDRFVVTTSSIAERFDFILIFHMQSALRFEAPSGEVYHFLAVPKPFLIDAPTIRPVLFMGLRHHLHIYGWVYGVVLVFFVWFIRRRLKPLRAIERAALRLTQGEIPPSVDASPRADEVGQLVAAFNHALDQMKIQEDRRKRMVADIAHELRTPLTTLSGRLEAYQDGLLDDRDALVRFSSTQVAALTRIVEDLSLLSRADAGELRVNPEPVDVGAELSQILEARNPHQDFACDVTTSPVTVPVDRQRFSQIINNLISNALQAKPEGLNMTVDVQDAGDHALIRIEDNGPGVAAEHLPRLFDRLYRVDHGRAREDGGSGLGLSIVKSLVKAHGGRVEAYAGALGGLGIALRLPKV